MITVFYDDRCPLCRREIEYYKNKSASATINWCGISQHICTLEKHGVSYLASLKMLHAINAEGKICRGIDAFILIWQQLAGWKWLAWLINLPVIYRASKELYSIFAHWRFNGLSYCEIEKKNNHPHDNHI